MSLKSFFNKLKPGKKDRPAPVEESNEDAIQHEISFEKMETAAETRDSFAEIDVFVHNERTNIHTLAPETRIGRDPSQSDIIISELIVSKLHCTIFSKEKHYYIRNEGSTNGVFVNQEQVEEALLKDGDCILLGKKGSVKLVFHQR